MHPNLTRALDRGNLVLDGCTSNYLSTSFTVDLIPPAYPTPQLCMLSQQHYVNLDSVLSGTIKPHLIRNAWDETVRVIASIEERIVSPSLVLHRLGSYARQNSVYQALAEIGRVQKTVHILKTLDDEDYRRGLPRSLAIPVFW
jgi:hypothetical protein